MLRKSVVRSLVIVLRLCYIVICTVLYVAVIILFVMEGLQIQLSIFENRGYRFYKLKLFKNRVRKDNSFCK